MAEPDENEKLMTRLINLLSDRFPAQAILRGGMELRLLNCPRHTNDLDYVFVPFSSKKDILRPVLDALKQNDISVEYAVHSTCIQMIASAGAARVQLEVGVLAECKTQELSTTDFSRKHNMQGRVIRAMSLDVALSHKLSAWLERGLLRDLFDVHFIHTVLGVCPDIPTIKDRLARIHYQKKGPHGPKSMSLRLFAKQLRDYAPFLTPSAVEHELRDIIDKEYLPGLELKIRAALMRIADIQENA